MQTCKLSELNLPFLPVEDREFSLDPVSRFIGARKAHPWLAKFSVGYVVTENRAMREMMRHDDCMVMGFNDIVEHMGATGTPWGDFIAGSIQAQSGTTHARLRDALRSAFTPRQANLYRGVMQEVISELLDEWLPRGAFDFEEFISHYPISVLCRMIGADPAVVPRLRSSLEALGLALSMDRKNLPELQRAMGVLNGFVDELAAERRAGKRPSRERDLLDLLLEVRDSDGMNDDELYNLMVFLFGGGYDTSKNVLTLIMHTLLDRPEVYARCAEDLKFCRKVMEEALRFHGPATAIRKVTSEFEYRGVNFPEGTLVMFPWGMSGRDETAIGDPHVFDPDRGTARAHYAFGLGSHICLGQFIARVQIEEGLHQVARRIRNPRLVGPVGWRPFPGVWGIAGLPIEFDG